LYTVQVASPVAGLRASARAEHRRERQRPLTLTAPVRIFDAGAIGTFLSGKPDLAIAIAGDRYRPLAENLSTRLRELGLSVAVADERSLFHRQRYPRVFDPYIKVFVPTGVEKLPSGATIEKEVKLQIEDDGRVTAMTPAGVDLGAGWRQERHVLATVTGKGFIDYAAADGEEMYEPGCKIYSDGNEPWKVVHGERTEVKATRQARERWSRPWARLSSYVGGFNLTPQLPEAYACHRHLILLGDSTTSELVAALQASELLTEVADDKYPGPGKALVSFAWSPFGLEKNAIVVGASDPAGIKAGTDALVATASLAIHGQAR